MIRERALRFAEHPGHVKLWMRYFTHVISLDPDSNVSRQLWRAATWTDEGNGLESCS